MKNSRLFYASLLLGLFGVINVYSQTCTISASGSWASRTCVEGGVSPFTSGVNIVVPNGVSLDIDSDPAKVGNLTIQSGGIVTNNNNGANWNGTVTVLSGGSFYIEKKINFGSSAGCGNKLIVESGGLLDITGGGASGLITICGAEIAQSGGGCQPFPNGTPPYCEPTGGWPSGGFTFDETGNAGINYTWDGSSSTDWQVAANWTPTRTVTSNEDLLTFPAGALNQSITNIPSATVGAITVTGGSYTFRGAAAANTLFFATTTGNASGNILQVNNGATLTQGGAGSTFNINVLAGARASIGGQVNLFSGSLNILAGSTLTLHTNATPLARTSGQVALNATSILQFGDASNTTGSTIVLPSSIFPSGQTISSLVMNRTNGATLGNQSITVTSGATFTLGNLNTNAAAQLIFSATASSPTESTNSKIIGYAQMASRAVGTGALDFLGFSIASGANNVGNMTIVRRTGTDGRNSFNSSQSIDASWDVTATTNPAAGRSLVLRWLPAFDNVNSTSNPFRTYFYNGGPGWTQIGTDGALSATTPLRATAARTTTDLNDTFTAADNTQTLPVTFSLFTAETDKHSVNLFWTTAVEINNEKFVVEKKTAEGFASIGELSGAGNSTGVLKYEFKDTNPAKGWNYYRIKQIDYDGQFDYSKVVGANFDGLASGITIYPNPAAQGSINFSGIDTETAVVVQDLRGRVIYSGTVNAENPQLEVKNFASSSGLYYVVTQAGATRQFHRVVIK